MKVAFIGGGTMAEAMVSRLLGGSVVSPEEVSVVDVARARRELLRDRYHVTTHESSAECICGADVVVLAVKPQDLDKVAPEAGRLGEEQLLLSILAGTTLGQLVSQFDHRLVVRAMPNTPAQIGMGMTVWTAMPDVTQEQLGEAHTILSALGEELFVPEEKYVDMATALSGSGPAYVFLFVESLIDGAVGIGMPRPMAEKLALQTVRGSTEYLSKSDRHPAELRNMVTSPAGTTAAALHELEKGSLRSLIANAIAAAYARAKALQH